MTLHVSFEQFSETAKRVLGISEAYLSAAHHGTTITSVHPSHERLVTAWVAMPLNEVKKRLEKDGLKVFEGSWTHDGELSDGMSELATVHVAAVSYLSGEDQPGVWIDAFQSQPTQVQVLKGMYEEFRSTGEMPEVSFEEFVRLAKPTVVVASPPEIAGYLDAKESDC